MHYSLNQIEHTCRKAVRGAGLSWGAAEDAGRAVRWLEMMQFAGAETLAALLQGNAKSLDAQISVLEDAEVLHWQSADGALSPLIAGPCIGDYINASNHQCNLLRVDAISYPLLYIGFIGTAICQAGSTAEIQIDNNTIEIQPYQIFIEEALSSPQDRKIESLQLRVVDQSERNNVQARKAKINSRQIASNDWHVLEGLAHRTYVEATDASRLAGAGAGLSDND